MAAIVIETEERAREVYGEVFALRALQPQTPHSLDHRRLLTVSLLRSRHLV